MLIQSRMPCFSYPAEQELDVEAPTVFVVDPDRSTGEFVRELLEGYRLEIQSHGSAREFYSAYLPDRPACLVLEQRIPDVSGLQLQRRLAAEHCRIPMIFTTSSIDVSTAVSLMRGGAVHILEKPLRSIELLNAIQEALTLAAKQYRQDAVQRRLRESITRLSHKERMLVGLLAAAKSTKAIATELAVSQRAVEMRRSAVMEELGLKSLQELIYFSVRAAQECRPLLDAEMPEALVIE